MDEIVSSIKEKRGKLNWTIKVLAQKANIPYGMLLRIEKGNKIGMEEQISFIEVVLNKALNLPYKKWSLKYDRCTKCGTTQTRHASRGFCKNCYDRDIAGRHKDVNRLRKYGGSSSLLTKEYLLENYVNNQKSLGDIAKEANCSRQYVHKVIVSHGIPLRTKSSARNIALSNDKLKFQLRNEDGDIYSITLKKIHINENFFSSWSAEMAYVLGTIYTDGSLNPGRLREPWRGKSTSTIPMFSMSQKERELLDKVLFLMDSDANLLFSKERKYGDIVSGAVYHFTITSEKIYDDLLKFGLTPHKSLTLNFPNVPKEYVRHFIRGCWDGDGSVYISKENQRIGASFVSGSRRFIEGMAAALKDAGLPEREISVRKGKNPSYSIRFSGTQIPKLYDYLYHDVPDSQYLERKYKLFCLSLQGKTETLDMSSHILFE